MRESISISALEHWSYCPRQCGLIHVESVWDENIFTTKGAFLHERVDQPLTRSEKGFRVERALPVWSDSLSISGKCDVVEFSRNGAVTPIEYKSGGPRQSKHAAIQLCAQALCLEEMFQCSINIGGLYFYKTKERVQIPIDDNLREKTLEAILRVRDMLESVVLPPPVNDRRCPTCSLIDACLPGTVHLAIENQANLFIPKDIAELP